MYIFASCDDYFSNLLFNKLKKDNYDIIFVNDKNKLKDTVLNNKPEKILFFHWSYIVPKSVYNNYECINFHTSNLPEGKGGTPLQNQIMDGIVKSRCNLLQMSDDGIDGGPIYCSQDVTLQGNLFDIWYMLGEVAYQLFVKVINDNIKPIPQEENNFETYKRRKNNTIPFEKEDNLLKIYDFIRMLDYSEYHNPYIKIGNFKLEFDRAKFDGKTILSDVKITKFL